MARTTYGWLIFAIFLGAGCKGEVRADLPNPIAGVNVPSGNEGYKSYVDAAESMEERAAKVIGRTAWSPDQRDAMVAAAAAPIAKIRGLADVQFGKTWTSVTGPRPHTRGWWAIGKSLAWRIEDQVKTGENGGAVDSLVTAVRMGAALATSDAQDADLGMQIVDDAITAIWPGLPKFGAGELSSLSGKLQQAIQVSAGDAPVAQEEATVMAWVAWLQGHYQNEEFSKIEETLGTSVEPAVKYLRKLSEKPAAEQREYWEGFLAEMREALASYAKKLKTAPSGWPDEPKRGTRAWQRFARAFGTPCMVYVEHRAVTRTRLRLLALDAALLAQFKSSGHVPRTLSAFPAWLSTDPFSGRDLTYVARGVDYKLYSVGPDRVDNAGDDGDLGLGR